MEIFPRACKPTKIHHCENNIINGVISLFCMCKQTENSGLLQCLQWLISLRMSQNKRCYGPWTTFARMKRECNTNTPKYINSNVENSVSLHIPAYLALIRHLQIYSICLVLLSKWWGRHMSCTIFRNT